MKKILLLGGSGYIGSILSQHLIKNDYFIFNVDNKIYTDQAKQSDIEDTKIKNLNLDFRNLKNIEKYFLDVDYVIILGGLVGDFITNKYLSLSQAINEESLINFINRIEKINNIKKLIFVSTCSNYGETKNNEIVNEEYELNPLSPYAKSKVKIENFIQSKKKKVGYASTILRFATAFGYSPRMRFDLTVNHFCYSIYKEKFLEIYDANTWRPYCHVNDFAELILKVLKADEKLINFQIFNAGSDQNNYKKKDIAELIVKNIPEAKIFINEKKSLDRRDYRVSFKKVQEVLNFKPSFSVEDGINEIINVLKKDNFYLKEDALSNYGNFKILDHVKK